MKTVGNQTVLTSTDFHSMDKINNKKSQNIFYVSQKKVIWLGKRGGLVKDDRIASGCQKSSEYRVLCSAVKRTTWGWVNDD